MTQNRRRKFTNTSAIKKKIKKIKNMCWIMLLFILCFFVFVPVKLA